MISTGSFWAKVDDSGGSEACWPWLGFVTPYGYGLYAHKRAHRRAYTFAVGPIPEGLEIDHICHNADPTCVGGFGCFHRRCCNPKHLEVVTHVENMRRRRGRLSRHVPSRQAREVCCHGHALTGDNVYVTPEGRIRCRACAVDERRRYAAHRKAKEPQK